MANFFPTPEIITRKAAEKVKETMLKNPSSTPKDRIALKQVIEQQQLTSNKKKNSNQKTNVTQKTNVNNDLIKDLNTQIVLLKNENALLNIDKHELEKKCDERLNELKFFGEEFNKCQNEKSELEKEKKKLKEENNRLKEESRGEKLVLSSTAYQNGEKKANSIMKSFINEYKKRGSVSGVWSSVKKLVKPGPKSKLLSKYTDDMNKRKIMLDVARILTEIKITRSHWDRFEKFFNDKYRIKDKYGNIV